MLLDVVEAFLSDSVERHVDFSRKARQVFGSLEPNLYSAASLEILRQSLQSRPKPEIIQFARAQVLGNFPNFRQSLFDQGHDARERLTHLAKIAGGDQTAQAVLC